MNMRVEIYNTVQEIRGGGLWWRDDLSNNADAHAKDMIVHGHAEHSDRGLWDGAQFELLCIDSGCSPRDAARAGLFGLLHDQDHSWQLLSHGVSWMAVGNYVDQERHRVAIVLRLG